MGRAAGSRRATTRRTMNNCPPLTRAAIRLAMICVVAFTLSAGQGTAAWGGAAAPCSSASLDSILQRRLHEAGVAAGALIVVRDGRIKYSGGFGRESPGGQPVDPARTVFRAASNSKPLVAAAVMQLVAQGRLDLHTDINRYLRLFKVPATFEAPVTLDALLTHSAGFDDHFLGALARTPEDLVPLGAYLADSLPSRVLPPAQRIIYSNHAIALAAYVVEVVSGEDFASYAKRHILTPLEMTGSTFSQPPPLDIAERLVDTRDGEAPFLDPYPAGSLVATPFDMGHFIAGQLGSPLDGSAPILPETARLTMLEQHFTPNRGMPGAAYGYFESDANGQPSLHHTGDGGDHSLLYLVPGAKLGFYLVYTAPEHADPSIPRERIAHDVIDHYFGCSRPFTQPPALAGFAARADRYTGTYRIETYSHATIEKLSGLGQQITVSNPGDGSLSAVLGGSQPIRLVETGPNLFRDPDGAYVTFDSDPEGAIAALSFTGAAVDDPGSARRLHWWETANVNLSFITVTGILVLFRAVSGLAIGWTRRRAHEPREPTIAWRLSGWIVIALLAAVVLAGGSVVTSGGVITGVPAGVKLAVVLINLVAVLGAVLVPATVNDVIHHRGHPWQRLLLAAAAAAAIVALPFLAYWNLIGLRY